MITSQLSNQVKLAITFFDQWAKKYSPTAVADHICYKCSSSEEFEKIRESFEDESEFTYQSIISKRRIAIIKFTKPFTTTLGDIWYLELSDQKPDGSQKSGIDHIEIYPQNGSLRTLVDQIITAGFNLEMIERPHHTTYDGRLESGLIIRLEEEPLIDKIVNQEILTNLR